MKKSKYIKRLFALMLGISVITSCSKNEVLPTTPINGLGGDTWAPSAIDTYLLNTYVTPYNIEVKYKWDPYELGLSYTLVPPKESLVQPVMDVVKTVWIDPYDKIAGVGFIRKYSPKQFVLIGSAQYNSDGTITLGEAEGGRKIELFVINDFDRKNVAKVKQMIHTIEHEFGHILNQNVSIPQSFKTLNPEQYTPTWFNNTNAVANSQGLVTAYAKADLDDDFVETVAYLLVEGQASFDNMVATNNATAANILKQKNAIIISYFKTAFNIDFKQLQVEVAAAIVKATT